MLGVVSEQATRPQLVALERLAKTAGMHRAARELQRARGRHAARPRFELTTGEAVAMRDAQHESPSASSLHIWTLVDVLGERAWQVHEQNASRPRPGNRLRPS